MKVLVNHSNHPSSHWDEKQKAGFDKIIDIPFPNIPPTASKQEVEAMVNENFQKIFQLGDFSDDEVYLYIAGEFSYCYLFVAKIIFTKKRVKIVIPTTERVVVEEKNEGGIVKKSIFNFVKWREIYF